MGKRFLSTKWTRRFHIIEPTVHSFHLFLARIKEIGYELEPRIADVRAEELGSLVEQVHRIFADAYGNQHGECIYVERS